MTNKDKILGLRVSEFITLYRSGDIARDLCNMIECQHCPVLPDCIKEDRAGTEKALLSYLLADEDTNGISDEAKNLSYKEVLGCYFYCGRSVGCNECKLYYLEDERDMCCDNIFNYHFSKEDCPYDPREK